MSYIFDTVFSVFYMIFSIFVLLKYDYAAFLVCLALSAVFIKAAEIKYKQDKMADCLIDIADEIFDRLPERRRQK